MTTAGHNGDATKTNQPRREARRQHYEICPNADELLVLGRSDLGRYAQGMSTARKLLEEALQLDETQRATLALELLDSLSPPDPRDEASWIEEIELRARRAISGEERGVDTDEAVDRISRDLGL